MKQAKEAYVQCLSQHANDPTSCEAQRLRFDAELKIFQSLTKSSGHSSSYSGSASAPPLGPITPNAYGPGIGMDATGRPVKAVPWP